MPLDLEQAAAVARALGLDEHGLHLDPVAGGDIAESCRLQAADAEVFLKVLPLDQAGLLSAEADGLKALAETDTVRTPRLIGRGMHDGFAWLALEYLQLESRNTHADKYLGGQLARLHQQTGEHFGWHRNNYIGRTPQINTPDENWAVFFADRRLAAQFDRLRRTYPDQGWKDIKLEVVKAWKDMASAHTPEPSLIHGDLWRGNAAAIEGDTPVIFDPAVHFADRECDLAMAHLFGGFSEAFYQAYDAVWPLPADFELRRFFYKLYHMLNHANLFGGPYIEASEQLCRRILRE